MDNRNKEEAAIKSEELKAELDKVEFPEIETPLVKEDNDELPDDLKEEVVIEEDKIEEKEVDPDEEKEEDKVETPEPPKQPAAEDKEDFKQRYAESSREARIVNARNDQFQEAIEETFEVKDPTEDELRTYSKAKGVEFDDLSQLEKILLSDSYVANAKLTKVQHVAIKNKELNKWVEEVDVFVEDEKNMQKYPELAGREGDFKNFCMKPTHRALDLSLLADAFLNRAGREAPQKRKANVLLSKTGASLPAPTSDTLNEEQSAALRQTNPRAWAQAVKDGKIKVTV